jgi:hypothetical protein
VLAGGGVGWKSRITGSSAGIGKTTLWRAGVSVARARGHRVLACRAAESEARLSYAALGDLFDFQLPDLPAPRSGPWTRPSSEPKSRALHQTSEPCRSRRWGLCARWPRPVR